MTTTSRRTVRGRRGPGRARRAEFPPGPGDTTPAGSRVGPGRDSEVRPPVGDHRRADDDPRNALIRRAYDTPWKGESGRIELGIRCSIYLSHRGGGHFG